MSNIDKILNSRFDWIFSILPSNPFQWTGYVKWNEMKYDENRFVINSPIKSVSTTLHHFRCGIAHTSTPFKTKIESIKKIHSGQICHLFPCTVQYIACCYCWLHVCWSTLHSISIQCMASVVLQSENKKYINHISNRISFRHQFTPLHFTLPLVSLSRALSLRFHFPNGAKVCWLVYHDDKYGIIHAIKPIFKPICVCVYFAVSIAHGDDFCVMLAACMTWRIYRTWHVEWVLFSSC